MIQRIVKKVKLSALLLAVVFLLLCSTAVLHLAYSSHSHHQAKASNHELLITILETCLPIVLAGLALIATLITILKVGLFLDRVKGGTGFYFNFYSPPPPKFIVELLRTGIANPKIFQI